MKQGRKILNNFLVKKVYQGVFHENFLTVELTSKKKLLCMQEA